MKPLINNTLSNLSLTFSIKSVCRLNKISNKLRFFWVNSTQPITFYKFSKLNVIYIINLIINFFGLILKSFNTKDKLLRYLKIRDR
jgi:hypothetical protein